MEESTYLFKHTALLRNGMVFHYTCNPPSQHVLEKYDIMPIGDVFGCSDPREVLLIPAKIYSKYGYVVREEDIVITAENLLRRLEKQDKYRKK